MSHEDRKTTGLVFNIQKFSVHDGPGIRTIVFFKGCPLSCIWCSNPESHSFEPELAYNEGRCLGLSQCVYCVEVCAPNAISRADNDKLSIDRARCGDCPRPCVDNCPSKAMISYGERKSVDAVLKVVEQDALFYSRSSGGMTLSGGEPLAQKDFVLALLREARRRHIDSTLETCGYAPWATLQEACGLLNAVLFDIKSLDPVAHKEQTGVSPERILDNFANMVREFPDLPVLVRTPVVPGFNDREEALLPIAELVRNFPSVEYELLPYHRLGTQKYQFLQRPCPMSDVHLPTDVFIRLQKAVAGALAEKGKSLLNCAC